MDDPSKQAVVDALRAFSKRTQEIIDRISDRSNINPFETAQLQIPYAKLKAEVKEAAERGKISRGRREQTEWERCYFAPAVMKAASSMRARTNTNPINANWMGSLLDAKGEFSYYLYQLEKDIPEDP